MEKTKPEVVVGIDYSIQCPAVCIHPISTPYYSFTDCRIHYRYSTAARVLRDSVILPNTIGEMHQSYSCDEERYNQVAWWVLGCLSAYTVKMIVIEDYAFAAKGRVFHIGENTGILKHHLWSNRWSYKVVAPTAIKKFATGKGNAKKDMMIDQFIKDTGVDLPEIIGTKGIQSDSPTSDIVDAFYVCKWAFENCNY